MEDEGKGRHVCLSLPFSPFSPFPVHHKTFFNRSWGGKKIQTRKGGNTKNGKDFFLACLSTPPPGKEFKLFRKERKGKDPLKIPWNRRRRSLKLPSRSTPEKKRQGLKRDILHRQKAASVSGQFSQTWLFLLLLPLLLLLLPWGGGEETAAEAATDKVDLTSHGRIGEARKGTPDYQPPTENGKKIKKMLNRTNVVVDDDYWLGAKKVCYDIWTLPTRRRRIVWFLRLKKGGHSWAFFSSEKKLENNPAEDAGKERREKSLIIMWDGKVCLYPLLFPVPII